MGHCTYVIALLEGDTPTDTTRLLIEIMGHPFHLLSTGLHTNMSLAGAILCAKPKPTAAGCGRTKSSTSPGTTIVPVDPAEARPIRQPIGAARADSYDYPVFSFSHVGKFSTEFSLPLVLFMQSLQTILPNSYTH